MKKIVLFAAVISLSAGLVGAGALTANAQAPASAPEGSGQALEIAPPLINVTADPGETIKARIMLRDISDTPLVVTSQINDFVAAGEDGTPKILLEDDPNNPYSIKDWISPFPRLTLQPDEIRELPVTITVPANASPGGYYGVVRFTATPPELEGTGVSLSASLGALVLLRVNGDAKEDLAIEEFSVSKNDRIGSVFESTPLDFIIRLQNTGNIHLQPVGQVGITDMFGNKLAAINVNLSQDNILPSSIRKFEETLDKSIIGNKMLFGRYTADLNIPYGDGNQVLTASKTFWVIPYTLIGIIIGALIVGFFILRHLIRRYNRHIIKKAGGRR